MLSHEEHVSVSIHSLTVTGQTRWKASIPSDAV
jgi:hypothetical protein